MELAAYFHQVDGVGHYVLGFLYHSCLLYTSVPHVRGHVPRGHVRHDCALLFRDYVLRGCPVSYTHLSFIMLVLVIGCIIYQIKVIIYQKKVAKLREDFSYAMIHDMKTAGSL